METKIKKFLQPFGKLISVKENFTTQNDAIKRPDFSREIELKELEDKLNTPEQIKLREQQKLQQALKAILDRSWIIPSGPKNKTPFQTQQRYNKYLSKEQKQALLEDAQEKRAKDTEKAVNVTFGMLSPSTYWNLGTMLSGTYDQLGLLDENKKLAFDLLVPTGYGLLNTFSKLGLKKLGTRAVSWAYRNGKNAANMVNPYNLGKKIKYIKNLEEFYTGVPHKPLKENPTKFMDIEAPKNNNYTLWSSDDIDYARMFATDYYDGDGTIYKVLVDKKLNLLDTPTPKAGEVYDWNNLPFTYKKNGVIEQHPGHLIKSGIYKDKKSSIKSKLNFDFDEYIPEDSKEFLLIRGLGNVKDNILKRSALQKLFGYVPDTDNFVNSVSLEGKFQGLRFNKVFDGHVFIGNKAQYYPINEVVLFKNTPRILIPKNKSKWSLLFKNIEGFKQDDLSSKLYNLGTSYKNYRVAKEFDKSVLNTTLKVPLAAEIPEDRLIINYSNPVTTNLKASLKLLEKYPSDHYPVVTFNT